MYSVDEIRNQAYEAANHIDINWDAMDATPGRHEAMKKSFASNTMLLPELISLYEKLTSGKSVVTPDEDTPLNFKEVEEYSELVADELYAGFVLEAVGDKYTKINTIIELSGSL